MPFEFWQKKDAEEKGKDLGEALASGMGVELDKNSYLAITAMDKVYVQLESLTKNAAKNAEKLAKKQQERKLDNLKNALKLELLTEEEYYEKLKTFRDQNLRYGSDSWYKCTEEIAAYNKRVMEEAEKQQRETIEKILALKEDLTQKLNGNEPWFETSKVTFKGLGPNGTDLKYTSTDLNDFKEEITLLENYRDRILELQNLGNIPQGVFTDISRMSVEKGLAAANAILLADEKTRGDFISGYNLKNKTASSVSGELLGVLAAEKLRQSGIYTSKSLTTELIKDNQSLDFIANLSERFVDIPESYLSLGQDAGAAFGDGFLEQIPKIMESTKAYFADAINAMAEKFSTMLQSELKRNFSSVTNTYQNTYTFNTSRDTTTQQLSAARNAATLQRLRGGA